MNISTKFLQQAYVVLLIITVLSTAGNAQPISLHPQNPHYFLYQGKPTVLLGSTEHYGAVVNLDFNYPLYLQTLQKDGLNTVRLFTGTYLEKPGAFNIQKNTLAPAPNRLLVPWARSKTPGYAVGGNKFDLNQWDEAYFRRLKDFMTQAAKAGVVVEVCLFSSQYGMGWPISPLNKANNVNQVDEVEALKVNTLQNGNLLSYQEKYVRKLVRELNPFDNLYFEIQNEPWADLKDTVLVWNEYIGKDELKEAGNHWKCSLEVVSQASNDWQRRIAGFIKDEEGKLPKKYLISQNIANFKYPIAAADPNVSIFNFHYALPEAVSLNYSLNKVIGFNETGFAGSRDATYRRQVWRFFLAGGSLFNHLDYSFSLGAENGQDTTYSAPGGGSPALRHQFRILKDFMHRLDLPHLQPDAAWVKAKGAFVYPVTNRKDQYALYAEAARPFELLLTLPKGNYQSEWVSPVSGQVVKTETFSMVEATKTMNSPAIYQEVALRISRMQ